MYIGFVPDYFPASGSQAPLRVVIPPTDDPTECFEVAVAEIVDDTVVEITEVFTVVMLQFELESVTIVPDTADVSIHDNDGNSVY